jgi:hypothetical protein
VVVYRKERGEDKERYEKSEIPEKAGELSAGYWDFSSELRERQ